MFCGFGAVVLLVLIINASIVAARNERFEDLRAHVMRQELELTTGNQYMVSLQDELERVEKDSVAVQANLAALRSALDNGTAVLANAREEQKRKQQEVGALKRELKALDADKKKLAAQSVVELDQGNKIRRFEGEGNRQYLTGLKLGGKRVLILLDSSASMLDKTVVNIVRRKVRDDASKRQAPKWRQAVRTVQWLIANLPAESSVQVYGFNTTAASLPPHGQGSWVPVTDTPVVDTIMSSLNSVVPRGGTSLENAFAVIEKLRPRPDNILLLTDGLPTQGKHASKKSTITGEEREKLFDKARRQLPPGIPVNTILFPMEGDPLAAALFWKVAVDSGGSFLTPTSDWP